MKGTAQQSVSAPQYIKGWNKAKFLGLESIKSKKDPSKEWTAATFEINADSKYPEKIFLTNDKDEPLTRPCSMIIEAFGGQPIAEGTDANNIVAQLEACKGRECALLLVQQKGSNGKMYFSAYDPFDAKAVLPIDKVGTEYTGIVQEKSTTTSNTNTAPANPNSIPF